MPKYAYSWYLELSGNYVVEAEDRDAAEAAWDESSPDQWIAQGHKILDVDSYGAEELP